MRHLDSKIVDEIRSKVVEFLLAGLFLLTAALVETDRAAIVAYVFSGLCLIVILVYIWSVFSTLPTRFLETANHFLTYPLYLIAISSSIVETLRADISAFLKVSLLSMAILIMVFFVGLDLFLFVVSLKRQLRTNGAVDTWPKLSQFLGIGFIVWGIVDVALGQRLYLDWGYILIIGFVLSVMGQATMPINDGRGTWKREDILALVLTAVVIFLLLTIIVIIGLK